jgi:beta-fructofuranosidase
MNPSSDDSIELQVLNVIKDHSDAMVSGDVDALLSFYAEDWRDNHDQRRVFLKYNFERMIAHEKSQGRKIDLSATTVILEGDTATVSPVTHYTAGGSITYQHTLKKDDSNNWLFVYTQTINWEKATMDPQEKEAKAGIEAKARASRAFREHVMSDPARPGYHFVMPEGIAAPFDPNGAIFWQGRYHLFYIFQDQRFGEVSDHWGHVSSTDLFHWRHHPTKLLEGMYSGNCFLNKDGIPTICYHQRDKGNAMAVALDDDLNEWQKLDVITPDTNQGDEHHDTYRSWDPFGFLDGDTYYAIFGGQRPGIARSPDLGQGKWQYAGDLFAHGVDGVSPQEDVSCADLFRLGNKDVLVCISHRLGCRYYLGEWKNEQFHPDFHAQMSWVDNEFFAPESLQDDKGRRIMWAWLMCSTEFGKRWDRGWAGTMSLPRILSLDEDGQLLMDVAEEIKALRYRPFTKERFAVQAGADQAIDGIAGDSIELAITMESNDAYEFGVKVCVSPNGQEETVISYDATAGELKIDTRNSGPGDTPKKVEAAPFKLNQGEPLKLRVFVDKSVVEVFANGRQAVMRRIFPAEAESLGVSMFSAGGTTQVRTFESWHISPSNPY